MEQESRIMMELKPCPFCGSKASLNEKHETGTWIVECTNSTCPASYMIGWDYDTPIDAIEAWNRRVKS